MFLHSGASLHGHEYSPSSRHSVQSSPTHHNLRRPPLLRSAFSTPKSKVLTSSLGAASHPRRHQRPAPGCSSRPRPHLVTLEEVDTETRAETRKDPPMCKDAAFSDAGTGSSDVATAIFAPKSVRTGKRRRTMRRTTRTSTIYSLCLPPPRLLARKKVMQKVLPRLLLQLQRLGHDRKSRPVMDVFPASRIAGPVIAPRMAKRFPGIFGVKRQLGYDDVVLVRRDDNQPTSDHDDEDNEDGPEAENIMAVYSPLKRSDHAEIVLEDGSTWHAAPWRNGSFEFVHRDEHGHITTVRWARRNVTNRPHPTELGETTATMDRSLKFTFSVIDPSSRRHPVMATLTANTLKVYDAYNTVSASHGRCPSTKNKPSAQSINRSSLPYETGPVFSTPTLGVESPFLIPTHENEQGMGPCANKVDDATKTIICVTSVWVALRCGWSPNYTPIATSSQLTSVGCVKSRRRNTWTRSDSRNDSFGVRNVISDSDSQPVMSVTTTNDRSAPMTPALTYTSSPPASPLPTPTMKTSRQLVPRRTISTGAAYMQSRIQLQQNCENGHGGIDASLTTGRNQSLVVGRQECLELHPAAPIAMTTERGAGLVRVKVKEDGNGGSAGQAADGDSGRKGVRARIMKIIHGWRVR